MDFEPFLVEVSEKEIRAEREKARSLRKTQWWQARLSRGICHYCGKKFPSAELTMDHLIPVIRGGKTTKGNCVPACKECNNRKKYMLPLEWQEYLDRLSSPEQAKGNDVIQDSGGEEKK